MKVQLAVCAQDLPTKASYQALVSGNDDGATNQLGTTEASAATTNPVWLLTPPEDLSDATTLLVQVVTADNHDTIVASATFALANVLQTHYHAVAAVDDHKVKIALHAVTPPAMGIVSFQLAAHDLPDTDFGMFRKQHTDGLYEVYSAATGQKLVRSNVVEDDLNPTWDVMELDLDALCGGNFDAPIRITVLDKDAGDKTQYLGHRMLTVNQLLGRGEGVLKHYPLFKGGISALSQGSLTVKTAVLQPATTVSRETRKHLRLVLTALEAQLDDLSEAVASQQEVVTQAQEAADAATAVVEPLQAELETALTAQTTVQSQLAQAKQQLAALQATAAATPTTGRVVVQLTARHLPDTDFGRRNKTDPIFEIFQGDQKLLRSNIVEDDLNPVWDPVTVDVTQVPGGSLDQPLTIVVSDKDGGSKQTKLGSVELSLNQLVAMAGNDTGVALPPTKKGHLCVKSAVVQDLVDHAKAAADFDQASVRPLADQCTEATVVVEAARAQVETAQEAAAVAQQALQAAQDDLEAAQLALESMGY